MISMRQIAAALRTPADWATLNNRDDVIKLLLCPWSGG